MKKVKNLSLLGLGLLLNLIMPYQSAFSQSACTRTEYYDGCGELFWTTGDPSCSNLIIVYLETECDD